MDLGFKGKTALVTGAGSQVGFGREIALLLAEEGIDAVAVTDIDLEGTEKTAEAVRRLGCKSMAVQADITDNAAVKAIKDSGRLPRHLLSRLSVKHYDIITIVFSITDEA